MLRRPDVDHILRAAGSVSNHRRFVLVGTGAVIITARHIPAVMMMTAEIDVYADGIEDPEPLSDLLDAAIGRGSRFHETFSYYCDGVGPRTATMPADWRTRATEYLVTDGTTTAICPGANDIAIAKLCAGREKDWTWLRAAVVAGIVKPAIVRTLTAKGLPDTAPPPDELTRRLDILASFAG